MGADSPPAAALQRLNANVASVVLGKPDVIRLAIITLLADGHLLLEDVPGVGKTLLATTEKKTSTQIVFKEDDYKPHHHSVETQKAMFYDKYQLVTAVIP